MPKSLLQMISQVQGELGLPQSATVIGNADPTTVQMLNLMQGLLDELREMKRWPSLQWEMVVEVIPALTFAGTLTANSNTITAVTPGIASIEPYLFVADVPSIPTECRVIGVNVPAGSLTLNMVPTVSLTGAAFQLAQDTYAFPSDFDYFNNRTMWDRTNRWELLGPDSPQVDQWHRSGIVVTGPRRHFRKVGPYSSGQFRIWPSPLELAANMQLVFEYLSTNTIALQGNATVNGSFSNLWTNDTDTPLLFDDLLVKGLKWKFFEVKGFNYAPMKNDWMDYVELVFARDGARKTLNLVKRVNPLFISPANVADGWYPAPIVGGNS